MQSNCTQATVPELIPHRTPDQHQHDAASRVYQGAVVVAILLFFVSLWSL